MRISRIFFILLFLLFFLFLVFFILSFFSDSPEEIPPTSRENTISVSTQLGVSDIYIQEKPEFSFPVGGDLRPSFPSRSFGGGEGNSSTRSFPPSTLTANGSLPRLVRLFDGPTAGYRLNQNEGGGITVQLVEQGRGNRHSISTSPPYSLSLISSGDLTRVLEGHIFSNNSALVLYEDVEDEMIIRSSIIPFDDRIGGQSSQTFEDNIRVITNDDTLFFFTKVFDGEVLGVLVDITNPSDTRIVWESAFTNWQPRWGRNSHITLSTPISKHTKGYVYLVDPKGEDPDIQIAHLPDGGSAFVDTTSGLFITYIPSTTRSLMGTSSISNQAGENVLQVPTTLPEKCDGFNGVFVCGVPNPVQGRTRSGHDTLFPDSWYQGDITLDDTIYLFDAATGEKRLLLSREQDDIVELYGKISFDIIEPKVSDSGQFFFFVNKVDRSLWMLRL